MILFNKETIEKLKKYENYFHTVLDLQYLRATSKELDKLKDIYVNAGGKVSGYSSSCYSCRYNLIRTIGLSYRESVKKISDETKISSNVTEIITDETKLLNETDAKANTTHTSKSKGNTRKPTRKQATSDK